MQIFTILPNVDTVATPVFDRFFNIEPPTLTYYLLNQFGIIIDVSIITLVFLKLLEQKKSSDYAGIRFIFSLEE